MESMKQMGLAYEEVDRDTKALLQIVLDPVKELLYANNLTFPTRSGMRQTAARYVDPVCKNLTIVEVEV
jgi:hypothetical protein